jgi:site-specific recombinase XerC
MLQFELPWLNNVEHAKKPRWLRVVLTEDEVSEVLVRKGEGFKDSVTMLPDKLAGRLHVFLEEQTIQRAVKPATLRHSFTIHPLNKRQDIRTVQELLGHEDVQTTIYAHVLNRGGRGVASPLDL